MYDGVIDFVVDPKILHLAIRNGLNPRELRNQRDLTDEIISFCDRLEVLDASGSSGITRCPPTVTELDASGWSRIQDRGLIGCDKLVKLKANHNDKITRCPPGLIDLEAQGTCGIGTEEVMNCTTLKRLFIGGNRLITKIPPSVVNLGVDGRCAIPNFKISLNEALRELTIDDRLGLYDFPPNLDVLTWWGGIGNSTYDPYWPVSLVHLTKLRRLDMTQSVVRVILPPNIEEYLAGKNDVQLRSSEAGLKSLRTLQLYSNIPFPPIPPSVEKLTILNNKISCAEHPIEGGNLRILILRHVRISGMLPESLEELEVFHSTIDPNAINNCRNIKKLTLISFCERMSLPLPSGLEELDINGYPAIDDAAIAHCTALKRLCIGGKTSIKRCPPSVTDVILTRWSTAKLEGLEGRNVSYDP